ncbi:hypothetical protein ABBQ38_003324 [Trebouxia sp. C0009 RCD-2024]
MWKLLLVCLGLLLPFSSGKVKIVSNELEAQKPIQLTEGTFDSEIRRVPASSGLMVEFYAHWCPTCQAFQPAYEEVAAYFHTEPKVQPEVWVARVDCATEVKLCNRFHVTKYPTMRFGHGPDFEDGSKQEMAELSGKKSAEEVVKWLSQQLNTHYDYGTNQVVPHLVENSTDVTSVKSQNATAGKAGLKDIESASRLAWKYMMDSGDLLRGLEARQAFLDFMELMSTGHPIPSCKEGSSSIFQKANELWPADERAEPLPDLAKLSVCGQGEAKEEWDECKGSQPGRRGYTCGLWMLLHSLAANALPEHSGGAFWMTAVRGFIQHFFQCSACANHFVTMTEQPDAESVTTRRDAVLWMWKAHNQVNARLERQEEDGKDGDPAFPKQQWPPADLCPLCHLPSSQSANPSWNEDKTYRFLLKFYSQPSTSKGLIDLVPQKTAKQLSDISHGIKKSAGPHANRALFVLVLGLAAAAVVACIRTRRAPGRRSKSIL